ncbi:MAG: hypothetical protein HZB99_03560 [Candidatus Harrisonbacteria bacterium]|nr:hypothetical protein [Candidatus Harrisonbacteria bacterium]
MKNIFFKKGKMNQKRSKLFIRFVLLNSHKKFNLNPKPSTLNPLLGFTLIETLIYALIITGVVTSATIFSINILESQQRARAYQEVQQNARFAMERIIQEIRSANTLNTTSSTFDTSPGFLSLNHEDVSKDPTVFGVSNYILDIKQGSAATSSLTSNDVKVTSLIFRNLSVTNRTKNINISLTVEHINPDNIITFAASTTMQTSVTIRDQEDLP